MVKSLKPELLFGVTKDDLRIVDVLDLRNMRIEAVKGIEVCERVSNVFLANNLLSNLDGLVLNCLWKLDASKNNISNVESLKGLLALGHLDLSFNDMSYDSLLCLRTVHILELHLSHNPKLFNSCSVKQYRYHIIQLLPRVWCLDGALITRQEREEAHKYFNRSDFDSHIKTLIANSNVSKIWHAYHPANKLCMQFLNEGMREEPKGALPSNIYRLKLLETWYLHQQRLQDQHIVTNGDRKGCRSLHLPGLFTDKLLQLDASTKVNLGCIFAILLKYDIPRCIVEESFNILFAGRLKYYVVHDLAQLSRLALSINLYHLVHHLQDEVQDSFRNSQFSTMDQHLLCSIPLLYNGMDSLREVDQVEVDDPDLDLHKLQANDLSLLARHTCILFQRAPSFPSLTTANTSLTAQNMYAKLEPFLADSGLSHADLQRDTNESFTPPHFTSPTPLRELPASQDGDGDGGGDVEPRPAAAALHRVSVKVSRSGIRSATGVLNRILPPEHLEKYQRQQDGVVNKLDVFTINSTWDPSFVLAPHNLVEAQNDYARAHSKLDKHASWTSLTQVPLFALSMPAGGSSSSLLSPARQPKRHQAPLATQSEYDALNSLHEEVTQEINTRKLESAGVMCETEAETEADADAETETERPSTRNVTTPAALAASKHLTAPLPEFDSEYINSSPVAAAAAAAAVESPVSSILVGIDKQSLYAGQESSIRSLHQSVDQEILARKVRSKNQQLRADLGLATDSEYRDLASAEVHRLGPLDDVTVGLQPERVFLTGVSPVRYAKRQSWYPLHAKVKLVVEDTQLNKLNVVDSENTLTEQQQQQRFAKKHTFLKKNSKMPPDHWLKPVVAKQREKQEGALPVEMKAWSRPASRQDSRPVTPCDAGKCEEKRDVKLEPIVIDDLSSRLAEQNGHSTKPTDILKSPLKFKKRGKHSNSHDKASSKQQLSVSKCQPNLWHVLDGDRFVDYHSDNVTKQLRRVRVSRELALQRKSHRAKLRRDIQQTTMGQLGLELQQLLNK